MRALRCVGERLPVTATDSISGCSTPSGSEDSMYGTSPASMPSSQDTSNGSVQMLWRDTV